MCFFVKLKINWRKNCHGDYFQGEVEYCRRDYGVFLCGKQLVGNHRPEESYCGGNCLECNFWGKLSMGRVGLIFLWVIVWGNCSRSLYNSVYS